MPVDINRSGFAANAMRERADSSSHAPKSGGSAVNSSGLQIADR